MCGERKVFLGGEGVLVCSMGRKRKVEEEGRDPFPAWWDKGDPTPVPTPRVKGEMEQFVRAMPGPRDAWREIEDRAMVAGNTMSPEGLWAAGVKEDRIRAICGGISFVFEGAPLVYKVRDYEEYGKGSEEVVREVMKLGEKKKVWWYEGKGPGELSICPSNVVVKPGKVRLVHDWSHPECGLNQILGKKEVQYGTVDGMVEGVREGSWMGGLDFADCFHHWAVSPMVRRLLGIRWPGTEKVGTFLFLPFGLVPAPGENEWFVRELVDRAILMAGELHAEVYVDDVRLVDTGRTLSSREGMNERIWKVIGELEKMGCKIHRKEGKLFEACQKLPFMGFSVDSGRMEIKVSEEKIEKGIERVKRLRGRAIRGEKVRAKDLLEVAGFLNYIEKVVQGGFARLRGMWKLVAESGANEEWQRSHFANPWVEMGQEVQDDLGWWEKVLKERPGAKLHRWGSRTFFWHPQLSGIRELVKEAPLGEVVVCETDAASLEGWGAHCQGKSLKGK